MTITTDLELADGAQWPAGTVEGDHLVLLEDGYPEWVPKPCYAVYSKDGKILRGWVPVDKVKGGEKIDVRNQKA